MANEAARAGAVLTLTIEYDHAIRLLDILEAAREIIDKASEQAKVEGYLALSHTGRIDVKELR